MNYANEFQRESHRIDQLIWDAMCLVRGERVLFCGYGNDDVWVRRAIEIGVDVSVIESDEVKMAELLGLRVRTLRGSTTMIPARDSSFDAAVAFHYLHEIDPTFHAQIVSELARVAKRIIVVEPAPPADQLGKRIAELYSRAKYEAGAFEEYQPIDYWRKLLAMVKADVLMQQFTFTRLAPRFAVEETVGLILDTMEIGEMPEGYMTELRELAKRPEAQLSPLSRFVLVALAAGEPIRASAGTLFREAVEAAADAGELVSATGSAAQAAAATAAGAPAPPPGTFTSALQEAEFPPVLPPPGLPAVPAAAVPGAVSVPPQSPAAQPPAPAPPQSPAVPAAMAPAPPVPQFGLPLPESAPGETPFGVPAGPQPVFGAPETPFGVPPPAGRGAPFGTPFALPQDPDPFGLSPDPAERASFGWTFEPPDGTEPPAPGPPPKPPA